MVLCSTKGCLRAVFQFYRDLQKSTCTVCCGKIFRVPKIVQDFRNHRYCETITDRDIQFSKIYHDPSLLFTGCIRFLRNYKDRRVPWTCAGLNYVIPQHLLNLSFLLMDFWNSVWFSSNCPTGVYCRCRYSMLGNCVAG